MALDKHGCIFFLLLTGGKGKIRIFLGNIRKSRDEIGVLWLRVGEMRDIRPKIVVKLDKIPNISQKPSYDNISWEK